MAVFYLFDLLCIVPSGAEELPRVVFMTSKKADMDDKKTFDPAELAKTVSGIADSSMQLLKGFLSREQAAHHISMGEAMHFSRMFQAFVSRSMMDPTKIVGAQMAFWNNYASLMRNLTYRFFGQSAPAVVEPAKSDRRFKSQAWEQNPLFDYIKQTYLISADYLRALVKDTEGLDEQTAKKLEFYTEQFVDAMSPTNFLATNPDVVRETLESKGKNLLKGFKNILEDLEKGEGQLKIKMTDTSAFEVGKNIATTPGKVIFQNDMMQLIQYTPTTKDVNKIPVLIIPPWINRYYILDLNEKKSYVKWMVDQGYTVFLISWVNPDERHQDKGFDAYMKEGPLTAMDIIEEVTGEKQVHTIGYCLGGTLQATMLAYLSAKKEDKVKSSTFFTSLINFEFPGELEVFIDEEQIQNLEKKMSKKGFLEGKTMATTFNMLRANDLIWSYFVNNYLLGREPLPFDILYWNSDSTNLPARMHSYYLRNMYQRNLLKDPGGLNIGGVDIDVTKIKVPSYFVSTVEDHIAPWKSTYQGATLFSGPVKFVLGGSGHIAGIVNPVNPGKYNHWTNTKLPATSDEWLKGAKEQQGSWWVDWDKWVSSQDGEKVPARKIDNAKYKAIEDAPGSYVRAK